MDHWHPTTLLGHDVTGATARHRRFGTIGKAFAKRASGFDMHILAYSRHLTEPKPPQSARPRRTRRSASPRRILSRCTARSRPIPAI